MKRKRLIFKLFLMGFFIVCLGWFFFIKTEKSAQSIQPLGDDKTAPQFELLDQQGKKVSLTHFTGRPVILHFWATWCAPCMREIPDLLEAAQKLEKLNPDLVFLAVSLDRSFEEANRVLKPTLLGSNLISLLDENQKVPEAYGSYQYPESYILGRDQKVKTKLVGPQPWTQKEFLSILKGL